MHITHNSVSPCCHGAAELGLTRLTNLQLTKLLITASSDLHSVMQCACSIGLQRLPAEIPFSGHFYLEIRKMEKSLNTFNLKCFFTFFEFCLLFCIINKIIMYFLYTGNSLENCNTAHSSLKYNKSSMQDAGRCILSTSHLGRF